jgi:hypothetical protein
VLADDSMLGRLQLRADRLGCNRDPLLCRR